MESSRYPQATFKTTSITDLPDTVAAGDEISFTVTGDLTVKQTTKPVTWNVTMKIEEGRLVGLASMQTLMSDFGVGPLQLPIVMTEDQVKLFFDFVATPVEA